MWAPPLGSGDGPAQGSTMDRIALRHWPKGVGVALALLLLLSLLSFHLQDPTLTNLRLPSGGVANWAGLPGALVGGSLLELLGSSALLAPLLLVGWTLCTRERPAAYRYALACAGLLLALSGLHGLCAPAGDPGLTDPGLVGWTVRRWAALTTGPWAAGALLVYVAAACAARVLYAPLLRAAARDGRVFAVWFLREGWRHTGESWAALRLRAGRLQRVSGAAALGVSRRTRLGLGELLRLALRPPRIALAWLTELRAPSLARIKLRSAARPAGRPAAHAPHGAAGAAGGAVHEGGEADDFARWFAPPPAAEPLGRRDSASRERSAADLATESTAVPEKAPRAGAARVHWTELLDEREPGASAAPVTAAPDPEPAAAGAVSPPPPVGETDYTFERPEAEAAWRERFQRYARNLDLDWEEQLWRRKEQEAIAGDDDAARDND
jgi:4TM region of DNA translocase FtsK/SpoIIIE